MFRAHPDYVSYKSALLAALLDDDKFSDFLSIEDRSEFTRSFPLLLEQYRLRMEIYHYQVSKRFEKLDFEDVARQAFKISGKELAQLRKITKLMFLASKMGFSTNDFWTTLEANSFVTSSGSSALVEELSKLFVNDLKNSNPEIIPLDDALVYDMLPRANQVIQKVIDFCAVLLSESK